MDPRLVAIDLGFRLLPCAPRAGVEVELTTRDRIAWGMSENPAEERARQWIALQRGLDLRAGIDRSINSTRDAARLLGNLSAPVE